MTALERAAVLLLEVAQQDLGAEGQGARFFADRTKFLSQSYQGRYVGRVRPYRRLEGGDVARRIVAVDGLSLANRIVLCGFHRAFLLKNLAGRRASTVVNERAAPISCG